VTDKPDPSPEAGVALWILSWRRWDHLERMLASLVSSGLPDLVQRSRIFFQEFGDRERAIAAEYGFEACGVSDNIGIAAAWQQMLADTHEPLSLFLENDCPVVEPPGVVARRLAEARDLVASGAIDVCRLRSVREPGAKFYNCEKYCRYWSCKPEDAVVTALRRWMRPGKARRLLGSAPYCIEQPERRHRQIERLSDDVFRVSSAHLNWTNQSVLVRTDWMRDVVLPRVFSHPSRRTVNGTQDIEKALNCPWWRDQSFRIGVGSGLFTHL